MALVLSINGSLNAILFIVLQSLDWARISPFRAAGHHYGLFAQATFHTDGSQMGAVIGGPGDFRNLFA
ncbi:hypothetical protein [Streptomyces sp. NPDC051014]|uniref:hypothetical protein n=1 Tax=Streptomyces sp. NPDC051014 TaxID=3155751 RepID=UPI0033C2893D